MATDDRTLYSDDDLALVIGQYALGRPTLGAAAERLDISRCTMAEALREAGVELRIGLEDAADAEREVDVTLDLE